MENEGEEGVLEEGQWSQRDRGSRQYLVGSGRPVQLGWGQYGGVRSVVGDVIGDGMEGSFVRWGLRGHCLVPGFSLSVCWEPLEGLSARKCHDLICIVTGSCSLLCQKWTGASSVEAEEGFALNSLGA